MKVFHISDVLSVTTGRLVSSRHMEGVYDILNFLTSDNLFTHQLPRAMKECDQWLRAQWPQLFADNPVIAQALTKLNGLMKDGDTREERSAKIESWVEDIRERLHLSRMLKIYELGEDMHTFIDPIEEAKAMVGDDAVIIVDDSHDEQ